MTIHLTPVEPLPADPDPPPIMPEPAPDPDQPVVPNPDAVDQARQFAMTVDLGSTSG